MKRIFFTGLLLFSSIACFCHPAADTIGWQYWGLNGFGLMAGSSSNALSVTTTNGLHKGNWYPGITLGADWYSVRNLQIAGSVHKAFGRHRNQPFIYGLSGVNLPWQQAPLLSDGHQLSASAYHVGWLGEAGIGYWAARSKKLALSVSFGYSYKTIRRTGTYDPVLAGPGYYTPGFETSYQYRRIAFRVQLKI